MKCKKGGSSLETKDEMQTSLRAEKIGPRKRALRADYRRRRERHVYASRGRRRGSLARRGFSSPASGRYRVAREAGAPLDV